MWGILKQTSWLFSAQAFGRVIGFLYTIFLAKTLGVSDFGLYSTALAYFSLVGTISDFGFNRFLIREVARGNYNPSELLFNIGALRLTFSTIIFAILAVLLYSFDPDKARVNLTLLAVMAVLPQAIAQTFDAVFIAIQKLQFSALCLVALNLSTALLGVILINFGYGPTGAVVALILGEILYILILGVVLKLQNIKLFSTVKLEILKDITVGSLPYGLLGILGLLYFKIDTIMLSYIKGNFDAGIYSAAYRFLEAIVFIPSALSSAMFPVLAKLHDIGDKAEISRLYFKTIKIMFLFGILIMASYILILPTVIKILLPNYQSSIQVVMILSLTIPFIFIHVPGAQVLLSSDKYLKPVIWLSVLTLSFNSISNLMFIPIYGYSGAAWITVASEVVSFVVFFALLKNKVLK